MVPSAERDSELVTDLAAQRAGLGESKMVGVRGLAAAHETRLLGDIAKVLPVAIAPRRRDCQHALIDADSIGAGFIQLVNLRAARALLGWSQTQLARRAGLGLATLQRIERDEGIEKGKFSTVIKIQKALEQAGIHFTEDDTGEIGVRLKVRTR